MLLKCATFIYAKYLICYAKSNLKLRIAQYPLSTTKTQERFLEFYD